MSRRNSKEEEADVEVQLDDQERINAFSTLNHRLNDVEEQLQAKKVCSSPFIVLKKPI